MFLSQVSPQSSMPKPLRVGSDDGAPGIATRGAQGSTGIAHMSSGAGPRGAATAPLPATENARCRHGGCAVKPTRRLTTPDAPLTRAERQFVDTLTALASEIRTAAQAVNEFDWIPRERDAAAFDFWLATTQATALRGFVIGIINAIAAVRAALSQPWSNGPVAGQVNRLKMLKRQIYGRAKFDRLRSRVLHAA